MYWKKKNPQKNKTKKQIVWGVGIVANWKVNMPVKKGVWGGQEECVSDGIHELFFFLLLSIWVSHFFWISPVSWNLTCISLVCPHLGIKGSVADVWCFVDMVQTHEKFSAPGSSYGSIHLVPSLLALETNIRPVMLWAAQIPTHFLQATSIVCCIVSPDPFCFFFFQILFGSLSPMGTLLIF